MLLSSTSIIRWSLKYIKKKKKKHWFQLLNVYICRFPLSCDTICKWILSVEPLVGQTKQFEYLNVGLNDTLTKQLIKKMIDRQIVNESNC